jgi:hypothetical protein
MRTPGTKRSCDDSGKVTRHSPWRTCRLGERAVSREDKNLVQPTIFRGLLCVNGTCVNRAIPASFLPAWALVWAPVWALAALAGPWARTELLAQASGPVPPWALTWVRAWGWQFWALVSIGCELRVSGLSLVRPARYASPAWGSVSAQAVVRRGLPWRERPFWGLAWVLPWGQGELRSSAEPRV